MKGVVSVVVGLVAGAVGVGLLMLFLYVNPIKADLADTNAELAQTRAELVEAETDSQADALFNYCRGVIDQFLAGATDPEVIARNDEICLDIMSQGPPPGFRGPG